jgi:hypothetical protein
VVARSRKHSGSPAGGVARAAVGAMAAIAAIVIGLGLVPIASAFTISETCLSSAPDCAIVTIDIQDQGSATVVPKDLSGNSWAQH